MARRFALALAACAICAQAHGAALQSYVVSDGSIAAPLGGAKGDPANGRAIIVDRQKGLCLLCHSGPFPEQRFQGNMAPNLAGAGARLSEGELRLRMVDSTQINPQSIMPSYYRIDHLNRVASAFRDKPILDAQDIEDVIAFLVTLREDPPSKEPR